MNKFPENYQFSEKDKKKLLLAYHHLDERIKRLKLEDARKKLAESEQKKDNDQQTSTDTDSV